MKSNSLQITSNHSNSLKPVLFSAAKVQDHLIFIRSGVSVLDGAKHTPTIEGEPAQTVPTKEKRPLLMQDANQTQSRGH
ncbi:hypothetical protein [Bifidobacterium adolescentis]|uniref:hypothetical protein n=1 Tax=Bifidobacterium adolescentis TaxID=1680 RepID=UPI001C37C2CF|nr:hypothetical protein [Bifidobacterium adolescentis]MBV3446900.1 hypothetical protein [Bifidobacterium adolescentis]MBV3448564.1 hypothetical protein [Bifidobacterium adolescentis]MBV3462278.1 hypothetical protein [Bifidobacterium adolescentis]